MKILELGKFYPPVRGGIETLLKSFCDGFASKGAEVECVVAHQEPRNLVEDMGKVRVRRVASLGQLLSTSIAPGYLAAARRSGARIWHTHFPNPLADLAILAAPSQARVVVSYHSDIIRQATWLKMYGPILRRSFARADQIVVASPPVKESTLLRGFGEKVVVIPYGIDLRRFATPQPLPAEMPARRPGPILLTVGRLVGYKGHRWLIEAMNGLDATLWIVGGGPLEAELRLAAQSAQVADRVHFLGNVADEHLPALYQACDLFVLPSVTPNEAFGIVQLEAMACGKPVISCDLPSGVPWVNQQGRTGLIVPPRDAGALHVAIRTLVENPQQASALGEQGRARAAREFSEGRMVDDYYRLFERLAA